MQAQHPTAEPAAPLDDAIQKRWRAAPPTAHPHDGAPHPVADRAAALVSWDPQADDAGEVAEPDADADAASVADAEADADADADADAEAEAEAEAAMAPPPFRVPAAGGASAHRARPSSTRTPDAPAGPRIRPSMAGSLLSTDGDARALVKRAAIGAALASVFGVAIGARAGGLDLLWHALGVPAALLAVSLVGLPALYIVLALFDAPLSPKKAASAAVRGIASGGLALAGLAPVAALYVVTSASDGAAAVAAGLGLTLGGALGLRHLTSTLAEALAEADSATRFMAAIAQSGFALFAVLLAWRVWSALLPLVGGA